MIEKIERSLHIKDWNVYDKLDELTVELNKLIENLNGRANALKSWKKRVGWEEEDDIEEKSG